MKQQFFPLALQLNFCFIICATFEQIFLLYTCNVVYQCYKYILFGHIHVSAIDFFYGTSDLDFPCLAKHDSEKRNQLLLHGLTICSAYMNVSANFL